MAGKFSRPERRKRPFVRLYRPYYRTKRWRRTLLASRSVSTRYPRLLVFPGCGDPASPDRWRYYGACRSGASRDYGGSRAYPQAALFCVADLCTFSPINAVCPDQDPYDTGDMRPRNFLRLSVRKRPETESPSPQGSNCSGSTTRPVSFTVLATLPSGGLYRPIALANQEEMPGDGSIKCPPLGRTAFSP